MNEKRTGKSNDLETGVTLKNTHTRARGINFLPNVNFISHTILVISTIRTDTKNRIKLETTDWYHRWQRYVRMYTASDDTHTHTHIQHRHRTKQKS